MRKYFCGVLRRYISQNIEAIAGTLQLNYFITMEQLITSLVEKRTILTSKTSRLTGKPGSRIKSGIGNQGSGIGDRESVKKTEK